MAAPDPQVQLEAAVMARLGAVASPVSTDSVLASLLPGGVYSRSAGGNVYPFLTFTLIRMDEDQTYTRTWRYRFRYSISVTDAAEAIDAASAALQRVYELLNDADPNMPMEDFKFGYSRRGGRTAIGPTENGVNYQRIMDEWRFEVYPL